MVNLKNIADEALNWRREFHQFPELGFEEHRTSERVAELLSSFGLKVHIGIGGTGVIGTIEKGEGPVIGLRADMDALPIQELSNIPYRSKHTGCMHACGHDGHTAILLGAAKYLSNNDCFQGTIHFIFQPAEESLGGARKMIEDGLFKLFPVDAIYGLHNWPGLKAGDIAVNSGPIMASLDTFKIEIRGKGCHSAMPHLGIDPIVAAAELTLGLQNIVSRHLSPFTSAVVSVTTVHAGDALNVIPETATLKGTVRCLDEPVRNTVESLMESYVRSCSNRPGIIAQLSYQREYPVTSNSKEHADKVYEAALGYLGENKVHYNVTPSMASEDFSFMLEAKDGCYFWFGVGDEEDYPTLHNPFYDFNDAVIESAIGFWKALVEQELPLPK